MLKFLYATEADVPADLKQHYKANDAGEWVLICEGAVAKKRHDELRTEKIASDNKVRELETKFADVDPLEYQELKAKKADFEDGKIIKKDGVDALVKKQTDAIIAQHTTAMATETAARQKAEETLSKLVINEAVAKAALAKGLLPEAIDDVSWRASKDFKLVDGKPVAVNEKGEPVYGLTSDPLSVTEYVENLAKSKPYLFKQSTGGGSTGGASGATTGAPGVNPWKKESTNITERARITAADPALAARMKAEAGVLA